MKDHALPVDAAEARRRNLIGRRIARARRDAGLSLAAFSRLLEDHGVSIKDKGLSKWEQGETVPNAYQLMAVCSALDLRDLFFDYAPALNDIGLQKLADYRQDLIASGRYTPVKASAEIEYVDMPVCRLSVSAGTGMFLDGDDYDTLSFPRDTVPAGASFGLRVAGDSMEPVYHDGQIVWVQPCDALRLGEVGIFVYDGEGFMKIYGEKEPENAEAFTDSDGTLRRQPVMISYNKKYEPRAVSPEAGFQIVGRVLR